MKTYQFVILFPFFFAGAVHNDFLSTTHGGETTDPALS